MLKLRRVVPQRDLNVMSGERSTCVQQTRLDAAHLQSATRDMDRPVTRLTSIQVGFQKSTAGYCWAINRARAFGRGGGVGWIVAADAPTPIGWPVRMPSRSP